MRSIAKDLRAYLAAETEYEVAVQKLDQAAETPRGPRVVILKRDRTAADDLVNTGECGSERISLVVLHETDEQADDVAAELLALVEDFEQTGSVFVEGGRTVLAVYVEDQHNELPEELADQAIDWDVAVIELLIQHDEAA